MKHLSLLLALGAAAFCPAAEPETVFRELAREVLPAAAQFREKGPLSWEIRDNSGAAVGMLHQERIGDDRRQQGFGGTVEIALVVGGDGRIAAVLVGRNRETPAFLDRVVGAGFLKKWNGMTMKEAADAQVDSVTSATYTSSAIAHGVKTLAAALADEAAPANAEKSPSSGRRALEAEAAALERDIGKSCRILSLGTLLLDQWHNRRAEELELREILLLQGREAAEKFAATRRMTVSDHAALTAKRGTPLAAALAACRASATEENRQRLRKEIAAELDERIAALIEQNREHAQAILAAQKRLGDIRK